MTHDPGRWHTEEMDAGDRGQELWIYNDKDEYVGRGSDRHMTEYIVREHNAVLDELDRRGRLK